MATRSLEGRVTALEETVAGLKNLPNELAEFRRETNARFDQLDGRFAQVDARFAQVDARFEQVDGRFAQVDARFEQVDGRFDQVDARFDRLEQRMTTDKAELYAHMRMLHEELIERIKIGREASDVIFGTAIGIVSGRAASVGHVPHRVSITPSLLPRGIAIVGSVRQ